MTLKDLNQEKDEEIVRESEEKYQALYDNAPLSYQSLNEDGNFNDVNPAWLRTLGYDRNEVIGKWFGDFLHPDWKPHFEKNFQEFKRCGHVHDVQFKIRHKDGHYLDISFEGYIGNNPDGSFKQTYCVFQDITERKQADEALQDSEERFRTVFDDAPAGIGLMTAEGRPIRTNRSFQEMFGYSENELQNMAFTEYTHPDDVEDSLQLVGALLRGESDHLRIEKRYYRKDGRLVWGHTAVSAVRDANGEFQYFIVMVEDITERKQAEEEKRLHAAMMDNVAEGIYLVGLDDLIIKWTNEKFERMFGYDPGEMVGKQVDIVNAPTERTPTETRISIVDILKETGEWHGEVRNIKRDGTHFWCYANVSLFDHPEYGKVIVSVHTDITERKKAELSLQEAEAELKHTIEVVPSIIIKANGHTGYFTYCNPTLSKILGFSLEEFLARPFIEFIHPDDRQSTINEVENQLKGSPVAKFENRYICKNGSYKWFEWGARAADEKGIIYAAATDITKRKQAEEELKKRMNELETFYRTTLGREERVIELKQEVNELLEQLGKNKKYRDYN